MRCGTNVLLGRPSRQGERGVFPFARVYEIIEGAQVPKAHGASGMMIWGDAYVTQRAGLKDDYGGALYDPATLARARTLALTEYVYRPIQETRDRPALRLSASPAQRG
jgi:hypothetical protein